MITKHSKLCTALALACALTAGTAAAADRPVSATPTAASVPPTTSTSAALAGASSYQVGTLQVERHGDHGTPVILIPGLASGAWAWTSTVQQLEGSHIVYVVTLPGFDGRPAVKGHVLPQVLQSLRELIATQAPARPVLIGHSLGGILALQLAQHDSASIAGVVSIDGLPVFPGTEALSPVQRTEMVRSVRAQMSGMGKTQFTAMQGQYMHGIGVLDAGTADRLAALSSRSDPAAAGEAMAEILALDLRANLRSITVPVLLLSPYNPADGAAQNQAQADKSAYYRSLMAGTPQVEVVSISPSRHFAMFDQPGQVGAAIDSYLGALNAPR